MINRARLQQQCCAGLFYLLAMADRADKNQLLAIWVLKKLGWTHRRIARLKLPKSHHTISRYLERACEMIDSGELPILAKGERALKITPFGSSADIEYLEGKIHQDACGGGRKVRSHVYDDEFKDPNEEWGERNG